MILRLLYNHDPPKPPLYTLSLHDALPIFRVERPPLGAMLARGRRSVQRTLALAAIEAGELPACQRRPEDAVAIDVARSEEHTSELQSRFDLVCRLLLEKKKSILSNVYQRL